MFIITEWKPTFKTAQAQIKSIPIWVHFHKIPMLAWTLLGINWLACHLGEHICYNEATEKMQRFEYAKCLIEIDADRQLPEFIKCGEGDDITFVEVCYDWRPLICTHCKCFGLGTETCIDRQQHINSNMQKGDNEMNNSPAAVVTNQENENSYHDTSFKTYEHDS